MRTITLPKGIPAASVLLPVHNGEPYLEVALKSILKQGLSDFELIVHDDASSDRTGEIIADLGDERIILIKSEAQAGIAIGLNRCIAMARSEVLIRVDADDIQLPHRFERQISFLAENPEVGVVGSWTQSFSDDGQYGQISRAAADHEHLRFIAMVQTPLLHPTVAMRRSVLFETGNVYSTRRVNEDYDLWLRLIEVTRLANIQEVLVMYRNNPSGYTQTRTQKIMQAVCNIQIMQVQKIIPQLSEHEKTSYIQLLFLTFPNTVEYALAIHDFIAKLIAVNDARFVFPKEHFRNFFLERWKTVANRVRQADPTAVVDQLPLSRQVRL
jgi:glycosyltransferase involved in cell wall biosynthesis